MPKRGVASSFAASSGDVHSAESDALPDDAQQHDILMFIDGGSPEQIRKYVVRDPRAYNYEELDALFKTHTAFPILCGFDCTSDVEQLAGEHEHLTRASISKNHLSWHLLVDNSRWQITKPLYLERIMGGDGTGYIKRYAALCELRHTGVNGTQPLLKIVLLKCVRGKAQCEAWHVTQETRRQLVDWICECMELGDMPTVLVGDIGMSFHYLASVAEKFSEKLEHVNLPNSAFTLLYRHAGEAKWSHTVQDYAQNQQIIIWELRHDTSDAEQLAGSEAASDDPDAHNIRNVAHLAGSATASDAPDVDNLTGIAQFAGGVNRNRQLQLMHDTKLMLGLLAGSCGDRTDVQAFTLWHPLQMYYNDRGGGEVGWKPTSIHSLVQQLNDALTLVRQARAHSGGVHPTDAPTVSLSRAEFDKALNYCKHEFHERFMLNENLRREYTEFRNDPHLMTRSQKSRIRNQFRGAFHNWVTKLVGDYNFFMTVLKHGIFDSTSRREFLQALREEKEAAMSASVDAHHAGDDGGPSKRARVDHDALRQTALHALQTAAFYNVLLSIRAMLYSLLTIHAHGHSSVIRLATKKKHAQCSRRHSCHHHRNPPHH